MTKQKTFETQKKIEEKAILIGVITPDTPKKYTEPLDELASLTRTAGAEVLDCITQNRLKPDGASYLGHGKLEQVKTLAEKKGANLIISDDDLLPTQAKNIEKITGKRVIDRTELILHIFANNAKSSEAKLQVELAQLKYFLPKLKRLWQHLDRYEGGIGTRGPGEKQIESDKRIIRKKIADLSASIEKIEERKAREVTERCNKFLTVALIGYTNAGKSTLMNLITNADVLVEDKLFSTLDTRTRLWNIEGRKILLSDTVGFIEKLPHSLVASFRATLEEAKQADLLLHIVDASHPDAAHQIEVVHDVLEEIGFADKTVLLVFNKTDAVEDSVDFSHLRIMYPEHISISAKKGTNRLELEQKVLSLLESKMIDLSLTLPIHEGKWISWFEEYTRILEKRWDEQNVYYRVRLTQGNADWVMAALTELKS